MKEWSRAEMPLPHEAKGPGIKKEIGTQSIKGSCHISQLGDKGNRRVTTIQAVDTSNGQKSCLVGLVGPSKDDELIIHCHKTRTLGRFDIVDMDDSEVNR